MRDFRDLENRYRNDPVFYQYVKAIYHCLETAQLTPSEVREAAMFACVKFEMMHPNLMMAPFGFHRGDK